LSGPAAALSSKFEEAGAELGNSFQLKSFDVVIGCTAFCEKFLHKIVGKIPTIWWIHEARAGFEHVVRSDIALNTLRKVDKIIFPTDSMVETVWPSVLNTLPAGVVEVIPYAVPPPIKNLRIERPRSRFRIVCVGSIYPRKRQADLIRAVHVVGPEKIECVLIGQFFGLGSFDENIMRDNKETFLMTGGVQPEIVHAWYASSDMFCLPSGDESMGIAPVEAAWHGLPVLLSDLGCYDGIWKHGYNALLHPVGDIELLAWNIRIIMESSPIRDRISSNGFEVAARFSSEKNDALFHIALNDAILRFGVARKQSAASQRQPAIPSRAVQQ
jgi:glycosyltransferase involved in cell wall biosynthesis